MHDLEVPAELPVDTAAFRTQQFRWAKGSMQTAMRLLSTVWRSGLESRVKIEGTLHLTAHLVFPLVLAGGLLHVPLVLMKESGVGPGEAYFALLGLGLFGLAGFFLAQLFAQRSLYPDWRSRLRLFPWFMAGTMGLSVSNTRAVWQALRGRRSPFVRTPKLGGTGVDDAPPPPLYADHRVPAVVWLEVAVLVYSIAGLVTVVLVGQWAAAPFQLMFVWGFGLIVWCSLADAGWWRTRATSDPQFDDVHCADYLATQYSKLISR